MTYCAANKMKGDYFYMKKNTGRILELADLQQMLLSTCTCLNRPIRKNQLIKMITEFFECNTVKEVEFALLDLIEQGKLQQKDYFIITPEFASTWDGVTTAADEGIVKYLFSLKEDAKHDLFFNVYAAEPLTPHNFFKYIGMKYPALLHRQDTAHAYLEQLDNIFPYGLSNDFYAEKNDYPAQRWFTQFFDSPDCRIVIKNIFAGRSYANFQIVLLPGKKRSYRKACSDFSEFKQNISTLFNRDVKIQVRRSLTTIPFGRRKGK